MAQSPYEKRLKELRRRRTSFMPKKAYNRLRTIRASRKFLNITPVLSNYPLYVESQYLAGELSPNIVGQSIHEANLIFVKSPKGTGKTQWLRKYVESLPSECSIIQIGHRRSLERTLAKELGLTCYLDCPEPDWRYALSIDSLAIADRASEGYNVIVIDESEQVFRQIISDTTEKKRGGIFRALIRLINMARQIICLDADLSGDLTVHLIEKLRRSFQQDRSVSVVNGWKTDRDIEIYESKEHLLTELICAVADGKRIYVPVGEYTLAIAIKSIIETFKDADNNPIKVLLLTGPTSEEDQSQAFFKNPNTETPKYQVVIATSTLSTGVSIDVKWFDAVYGLFDGSVYTFHDCDQAISRVRNCEIVKVWIHRGRNGSLRSESAIRSGPVRKELMTRSYAIPDGDGKLSDGDELYMDVEARIRWYEQNAQSNRTEKFIHLKMEEGWTVRKIPVNLEYKKAGKEMLDFGKDPESDKYEKLVLNADNLTFEQFQDLSNESNLRGANARAIKKYWVAKFFDLRSPAEVTLTQIKAYGKDGLRTVIKNAKLLTATRIEAINSDRYEREDPKSMKTITSFDHRSVKRDILIEAQKASGINYEEVLLNAKLHSDNEREFIEAKKLHKPNSDPYRTASKKRNQKRKELRRVVTLEQIDRHAEFVNKDLDRINLFFATNFKTPTAPETKTKVFNTIMGELGVELKKSPKKSDADKPEYFIDYDRVAELVATKDWREIFSS